MKDQQQQQPAYYTQSSGDLGALRALIGRELTHDAAPHAVTIEKNIPLYDMAALGPALDDEVPRQELMGEWARILGAESGIILLRSSYPDTGVIDRASDVFGKIIEQEKAQGAGEGDHFAASGANDRVWNSAQKHCLADPEGFAQYYGNRAMAAACEAWLGPAYQMTAQVNQVRPGGKAQMAHRDYHLGFQSAAGAARFPAHLHHLTAALTLQGAVAHCDMPVASGPTKLLPFSQLYGPGYIAFHDEDHRALFEENYVQMPLEKGDLLFFNPALFHAAGANSSTDILRMANLLQVSSAFGRAMEALDRQRMCEALYPALHGMDQARAEAAIAACAEGYAFPTNLDTDPPLGGNAPESQAGLMRRALAEGWDLSDICTALAALTARQQP